MSSEDGDDAELRAAMAASLADMTGTPAERRPQRRQQPPVVDLTGDTGSESEDVMSIYPKSRSVIGSDTDNEEDEGMKRAMALSLQEFQEAQGPSSASQPTVESTGTDQIPNPSLPIDLEDDDEDLKKAIALSKLSETSKPVHHSGSLESPTEPVSSSGTSTSASATNPRSKVDPDGPVKPTGILGLDRKQMEQERLARLAKRKADDSTSLNERTPKYSRTDQTKLPQDSPRASNTGVSPPKTPSLQYPGGVVKKTWAFGYPRQGDDIKIEEVLQKSDLELAVLSSFMWSMDWLFSKTDTRNTRFLLIMQAKEDALKRQYESEAASLRNVRLCFPPMDGQVNCMHSKLMLLFHPSYVRIAVPTANLTDFDWGEMNGVMENSVFLIDLPKLGDVQTECPRTAFYEELVYFLRASTLDEAIIARLKRFDFAKTAKYAFVHTIGGAHTGTAWERTGYCGLGRAVRSMGLRTSQPLNLDFVSSSLGSLSDDFLRSIYLASQGDNGITDLTLRSSKTFPVKHLTNPAKLLPQTTASEWKNDRFRAYFPSKTTVAASKGGAGCAGTVCFQSKWYDGPRFPRNVLRDCQSQRPGLLMHNKILYVRPDEPIPLAQDKDTVCPAWAYVGSANLSESAWGRLVIDRTTKQPKLNCRNWECGVLVRVLKKRGQANGEQDGGGGSGTSSRASSSTATGSASPPQGQAQTGTGREQAKSLPELFAGTVPVPMRVPGRQFEGARRPWFFSEDTR
ncbi:uncharacterized protein BO97DRAFT_446203 [Aspergillus homomorphus CBS 101889]|uniref:Phospholipase D/nuclease n=1 Tax=Aspergillus homomorphus (strain CBS 101889) TaxID=1450537 RepID=A0A395HN83_ASPHC|nr:phospholipase D/nuclease [Aspergillus homomorphus CBS 101889]RAL08298.1 phospholipase D/nuclease [Aspergillus homomorphus CBS 101889]